MLDLLFGSLVGQRAGGRFINSNVRHHSCTFSANIKQAAKGNLLKNMSE